MCGITGVISPNAKDLIKDINDRIHHRGPDDEGVYCIDNIALGHQRLSILDLSMNGHQPMVSEDGRYVLVFNGEIYNHQEIRDELIGKYAFKSTTDTETILYGFIEYGVNLFNKLNGIFAFSILDTQTKQLILVRDQFGIKPLYYYHENDLFLFGSELKAIGNVEGTDQTLDYKALVNYVNFLWSPGERTPLKHFKKLLPGHYISINTDEPVQFQMTKYYDIGFNGQYEDKSEEQWIDELDEVLQAAVQRQLLSDVPIGFFLSGGLDSSLITALAAKIKGNGNFNCYTIKTSENDESFEGFANDLHYARKVAQHLGVKLIEIDAQPDILKDFDKMVWHLDEPQADVAPLNVLNICKAARKNGDIVLLGGTAGDDIFSGYRRHQAMRFEKVFRFIPPFIGKMMNGVASLLNIQNPIVRRIRKITGQLDKSVLERMASYYQWIPLAYNKAVFSDDVQEEIKDYDPQAYLLKALQNIPKEKDRLNQLLYWDIKYFLTDHNLNYTDKLSMAVGIEVRVPFLDKELVEFSTKVPPHLKLKGNTTKYLLKKVAERYLPHDVIYRPKSGFGAPVRDWILNNMDEFIETRLSKQSLSETGIFNFEAVQKVIEDNKSGKVDASYMILSLLSIESWYKHFIKK